MLIEKWKVLIVGIVSLLLVSVFFLGVHRNEFLFLHDELLALNYHDAVSGLYVRNANELNVDNTTILTVTILDKLYYFLGFSLGVNLQTLQKIFYFIKLFILILVPYIGFKKFSTIIEENKEIVINDYIVWLVTFLYAFNTYTTIYFHGNAFQFSLLLCYALAPLALYYFKLIITSKSPKLSLLLKEALIFMAMSFSVYFFAVFLIILLAYYFSTSIMNPKLIKSSLVSLAKLAAICAPLFAVFLPMLQVLVFGGGTVNATGGETFTNLQGGLLYQIFLWFSWGIYTGWSPKNIFTFSDYYLGILYLLSPLAIFATIFYGIKNKLKNKEVIYFLVILLVTLTLVKGPQPPFQEIYMQLIKHFPPFRVFRSPDNKFGFGIILSLCFLLLLASSGIKKRIFIGLMVFIVSVQSYLIFTGIAIKGQNTEISSDRIVHVPDDYKSLATYLDDPQINSGTGYILPIPPTSFGHFILSPNEKHLGQDLVPKLIKNPYLTPDQYSSMSVNTYSKIQESFENELEGIDDFPIDYFLLRRDLEFLTGETDLLNLDGKPNIVKVFENNTFTLYKNRTAAKIVETQNAGNMKFEAISPAEYKVHINNMNPSTLLVLNTNFNSGWKVYIGKRTSENQIPFYPNWNHKILNTPNSLHNDYANQWNLNIDDIQKNYSEDYYEVNDNGTINADFTIYYQPQTNFYILAAITVIFALIYATFIIASHDK